MALDQAIRLNRSGYPDFGEVHFVVDSDYRTAAQGWSRADRTGPLDLYEARKAGSGGAQYVYRTGDYTRDQLALQAAIDATVDFRNDMVYLTPGSYSIGTTALALNSSDMRLAGPPVHSPRRGLVTITDAIGSGLTVSVDGVELANFTAVPLTATAFASISNGADYGYIHNVYYNANGVDASTSTEFVNAADTTAGWLVEDSYFVVDALQGDCFTWADARYWEVRNSTFLTLVASYATVFTLSAACVGNIVRNCYFTADADGTFTNIFTGAANEDGQLLVAYNMVNGTALATATAIETGFGTTTDIELVENYQTQDATTQGGTLIVLA